MARYQLVDETINGNISTIAILKKEDVPPNTRYMIPLDKANSDYREYLSWVSEGNTPDASE